MNRHLSGESEVSEARQPTGQGAILTLLCAAQLMLILDVSVVNIALPSMQEDLSFSTRNLQWVISGYALTFGGLLMLGGRCGDLFGRLRLFRLGLVVFTLASVLGGLAPTSGILIAGRLLQGAGAAIVAPAALSLLTTYFAEGAARNRALGAWGAASAAGGAVGILIGGPLTALSWRAVLLINIPIGIDAVIAAPRLLRESDDRTAPKLDIPGAALITAAIGALVYALSSATDGLTDATVLVGLAVSIVLLLAFVAVEARTEQPLVPLRVFAIRNLSGGDAISVLLFGIATGTAYLLTLYLQQVLDYSPLATGLAFLPHAAAVAVAATLAGRLVERIGVRALLAGSMSLPGLLVNAIGLGGAFVAASIAVTSGVAEHEQGIASGLFNTAQQVGAAVGLATLVAIAGATTIDAGGAGDIVTGYRWAFGGTAAFAAFALVIAILVIRDSRPTAAVSPPPDRIPAPPPNPTAA